MEANNEHKRPPTRIQKGIDSKHVIKIEYCGGWGFGGFVMDAVAKIEKAVGPGKFYCYPMYCGESISHLNLKASPARSAKW